MGINWREDVLRHADGLCRCGWCGHDPDYIRYHDTEWGVPEFDGRALFEKLLLDQFQAGLSWLVILKKRENFRRAFAGFDPRRIAAFTEADIARLLQDPGIVRNRAKIEAAVHNARVLLEHGGPGWFSRWLWDFVDGRPLDPGYRTRAQVPDQTELSSRISRQMKGLGFRFCGPVVIQAFIQAVGLTNDHLASCHRHEAVAQMAP